MRCPEHDIVEVQASDIIIASHPSGIVVMTVACPGGGPGLRVKISRDRAVQLRDGGATWIVPDATGGHTLPRRPIPPTQGGATVPPSLDVASYSSPSPLGPLDEAAVAKLVDDLEKLGASPGDVAAFETNVATQQRRRTGGVS